MREIHAYQNDDGTYKVEVRDSLKTTKTIGMESFEVTNEGKIDIPRADIQIIAYMSVKPDGETYPFTVNVGSK